ncbi:Lipoprotein NlpD/LppB homolog [Thiomonas arsenitoxydans]|uniref:Lipoprotein NlpD/LppB homolog n=1 Tax=Thiomonas arsenitoxydans (strain DSM 22701 / CIP 110005 / 3As) TaxID=426114 RepID=D6CRD1_THIA3|nr:peptidoglycan DD-metalloendopeptidase family protein [Thiomonas arsenitoxydans]CAZ87172.1 putative Peptidase M23B [Thiomonas arsenitoxydans]CQR27460.1 Lipoprotein NlpD/LppB homolog [Thiomonas arsenitoxydans]CQR29377.1 Lipoprotein NlpD/LppB homolog [Thiomonas arsenitoxydans]CQR41061.1 Lipoprotein NlpD/LppB homolog [Thiomonas arsenitoxydans]CQR41150.1 Lipoprotein NlpD/LppB homolog [Thiomonas arsenitoxydans]
MRIALLALTLSAAAMLGACTSVALAPVPVESKTFQKVPPVYAPPATVAAAPAGIATAASSSLAGQPGYYTVQPGDTLRRIALQFGTTWQALAQWNNLDDPNVIEVGQVLRVAPPQGTSQVAGATAPATSAPSLPAGITAQSFAVTPLAPAAPVTAPPPAPTPVKPSVAVAVPPAPVTPASPPPSGPAVMASNLTTATHDGIVWSWPVSGKIIQGFNGTTSKGIDIAGNLGDPVYAAAAGRVVYAGSELRGFGKLIIIKHNDDYISVYAHNNVMLVKENETVKRGQKIAEMGSTDAPRVELHFEIRLRGKSIDPIGLLPKQP